MKMTLAERLKLAMSDTGFTQAGLAGKTGVSQAAIQKLTSGNAKSSTKIVEIANALGVSASWLSSGVGEMRADRTQNSSAPASESNSFLLHVLDLEVSAGTGIINREFVEITRSLEYSSEEARLMFDGRKADQIRIINVRGDSMSGTIEAGDLLFVDVSISCFDGDGIYAFLYDDTAHVKRLQKMKDKLIVISDNKTYVDWDPIEKDEMNRVSIFGKVIGSMPQTYRKHG